VLIGTVLDELERRDLKRALVTMCGPPAAWPRRSSSNACEDSHWGDNHHRTEKSTKIGRNQVVSGCSPDARGVRSEREECGMTRAQWQLVAVVLALSGRNATHDRGSARSQGNHRRTAGRFACAMTGYLRRDRQSNETGVRTALPDRGCATPAGQVGRAWEGPRGWISRASRRATWKNSSPCWTDCPQSIGHTDQRAAETNGAAAVK